jgi:plastocyanin
MPFAWRINITKNPKKGKPAIFSFEETPQVAVGDAIFWSNQDTVAHWPGLPNNDTVFIPNKIARNSTSQVYTPGQPGTINYVCSLHPNETGVIQVAPAPPPPPLPTPPTDTDDK